MKQKLLYGILTVVLSIFAFVAPFLDMFAFRTEFGDTPIKLFGDTEGINILYAGTGKEFNNAWLVLTYICVLLLLLLSILYIVMFVLELVKVKGSWIGLLKKIAAIGLIVVTILTIVFVIIASSANYAERVVTGDTMGIIPQVGVYLSFISLLAGITGFLSCGKEKTTRRKK